MTIRSNQTEAGPSTQASPALSPPNFQYQSAFPFNRGRLAMLVFISTEIMFFTALIASYIVLRYSANGQWPSAEHVHVELWIGIINTIVLVSSCFALFFATQSASGDDSHSAKFWILVTFALGSLFLSIKGYEYYNKYRNGIYPSANRTLIFHAADEKYLASTVAEVRRTVRTLEENLAAGSAAGTNNDDQTKLEQLRLVQSGIVEWTQFNVSRTGNTQQRQNAIESLAHQIKPLQENPKINKFLADEVSEVELEKQQVESRLGDTERLLQESQEKIKRLLPLRETGGPEIESQFADESRKAEQITNRITEIRNELTPIQQRQRAANVVNAKVGINAQYGVNLPMVIPQGRSWVNTYYLLTGFHALHILAGLVVLVCWLGLRFGSNRVHLLENFGVYWHFVDLVWLIIFAIIYLN